MFSCNSGGVSLNMISIVVNSVNLEKPQIVQTKFKVYKLSSSSNATIMYFKENVNNVFPVSKKYMIHDNISWWKLLLYFHCISC